MKIRSRLSFQFTLIVASILILFSGSVYFFSATYRKQEFYKRLTDKALTTGRLFIEVDEVDSVLLKIIDKNTVNILPQEEVFIFDGHDKEVYRSRDIVREKPTPEELHEIRQKGEYRFKQGNFEKEGIVYHARDKAYLVVASATDVYGLSKLRNLRFILVIGFIFSAVLTLLGGWIFSGQALRPISQVIKQVESITGFNLNKRVNEGNRRDEIAQLAITFNQMLNRIQEAFETQKSFVSNASHELRTPLTVITGQIEVTLLNKRDAAEYERILGSILEDIRDLNKLTNGLLEIAQADLDIARMQVRNFRVDELLWQARNDVMKRNPDYNVQISVKNLPENEGALSVAGIEPLFKTALTNLMDNGCKFSPDKQVKVIFDSTGDEVLLQFEDRGIGINEADKQRIFEPFYRAENARRIPGQGLGLPLTRRIVSMHHGTFHISSEIEKGTVISLSFPANHQG